MRVALVGAELEENLGLRYMASSLEQKGHEVAIVPFNFETDIGSAVQSVIQFDPQITGLSMVFTGRAREFCSLATALREAGYHGHVIAGGHFASFNCDRLLHDFPAFDSAALGEGEEVICALAEHLDSPGEITGLCHRAPDGSIRTNPSKGNPENLDALPFPKRTTFHDYFGKPIASVLTSRGCWRNCAFCSINAWYKRGGGRKFRIRSIENIVAEMRELYFGHGVRIFNFQDDNFFLPNPIKAAQRFDELRSALAREGVTGIASAVKARPDSITEDSIRILDELGLFRVFLGVENASARGLRNLNRKNNIEQILNALRILNDFDTHIAFNLLMFEPDTVMEDIMINLRFMERHVENPMNFCRAEAYAGTGLETKLLAEGRLLGDYFGLDYRLKDPYSEAFHQIANYAFFDRNFSDFGLHYFNMEVDFTFQVLRRFYPKVLSQHLRSAVRNFIKETNLDTYECLSEIYDYVEASDPTDYISARAFAHRMREEVDRRSDQLHRQGEKLLDWLDYAFAHRGEERIPGGRDWQGMEATALNWKPVPYRSPQDLQDRATGTGGPGAVDLIGLYGGAARPIPYDEFKKRMTELH